MVHSVLLTTRGRYGALPTIDHQGALWSTVSYSRYGALRSVDHQAAPLSTVSYRPPGGAMVHCPLLTTRGRCGAECSIQAPMGRCGALRSIVHQGALWGTVHY